MPGPLPELDSTLDAAAVAEGTHGTFRPLHHSSNSLTRFAENLRPHPVSAEIADWREALQAQVSPLLWKEGHDAARESLIKLRNTVQNAAAGTFAQTEIDAVKALLEAPMPTAEHITAITHTELTPHLAPITTYIENHATAEHLWHQPPPAAPSESIFDAFGLGEPAPAAQPRPSPRVSTPSVDVSARHAAGDHSQCAPHGPYWNRTHGPSSGTSKPPGLLGRIFGSGSTSSTGEPIPASKGKTALWWIAGGAVTAAVVGAITRYGNADKQLPEPERSASTNNAAWANRVSASTSEVMPPPR